MYSLLGSASRTWSAAPSRLPSDGDRAERTSGFQLRTEPAREAQTLDEPFEEPHESPIAEPPPTERQTVRPPSFAPARAAPRDPSAILDEVLFRAACGDLAGAIVAGEELLERVPVVIMPRKELRAVPLGYWELHLVNHLDGERTLLELCEDARMSTADAIRAVCELVDRKIIAMR